MASPRLRKGQAPPTHRFFVSTPRGLEGVLLAEMEALGLPEREPTKAGAYFTGTLEDCYRANLWLRTAVRVVRVVAAFPCRTERELYAGTSAVEWPEHLELGQTLAVRARLGRTPLTHSQFVSRRIKDAIVDQFRARFRRRPSVDARHPDVQVHAWLDDGRCILSLDSSGWPLFMRGYRDDEGPAPLKENLAAGLVALAGWHGERPFYDLMCGSGTLPVEAALLAGNRAPGLLRGRFGFQNWLDFRPGVWARLKREARAAARPVEVPLLAADRDPHRVEEARRNARNAGVAEAIAFRVQPLADFQPPPGGGLVLVNPPYGERMGEAKALAPLYKELGDVLKQRCAGMEAYVFTAHGPLVKAIGLRVSRRDILFNGPLECRLLRIELY